MQTKAKGKNDTSVKLTSSIHVAKGPREYLEQLITEIGYERKKSISATNFMRYLLEEFGEQAKKKLLKDAQK